MRRKERSVHLFLVFILLFAYAIMDMQTSSVTGYRGADRSTTHLMLITLIGLIGVYVLYSMIKYPKVHITGTMAACLLMTIWITVVDIIRSVPLWTMLTHAAFSLLWFMVQYYFEIYTQNKPSSINAIQKYWYVLFILYAGAIVYYMAQLFVSRRRLVVSNLAYNVLVLYPWFVYGAARKKQFIATAIAAVFIAISMKRGAIIAFAVMFAFYMLATGRVERKTGKYICILVASIGAFAAVMLIVNNALDGALLSRFSAEELAGGSGRNWLYLYILELLGARKPIDLLIGGGSGSSVLAWGTGAHNEWLEFTFSFGLIGVVLYLAMVVSMIRQVIRLRRCNDQEYIPIGMTTLYVIIVGMVGGIYFMQSSFFVFSLFGYVNGISRTK